jgi:hypothetical protein
MRHCCPCSSTSMRHHYPCSSTSVYRRCPCLPTSVDHRPRPLTIDIEQSMTSDITGHQPGSPDLCAAHHRFLMEQAYQRPSPDPPNTVSPSPDRTLHHDSPDPPGGQSPPVRPTSSMGGPMPQDVQPRGLDLRHAHHL